MRILIAATAVAIIVAGGTSATATPRPSSAEQLTSVGCQNQACNGRDPKAMHCDADAKTVAEFTHAFFHIEMRYSGACRAAWTRVTFANDGTEEAEPYRIEGVHRQHIQGKWYWIVDKTYSNTGYSGYTKMVGRNLLFRSCSQLGHGECTAIR